MIDCGRRISDVPEITNSIDIEGLLMTVDIEKAFDSINHSFLMCVFLKKIGFGNCVINGDKTTWFFKLERGTRQGDLFSEYLFIIDLEVVFSLIKANTNVEGLQFFSYIFLPSAYAYNTTFFLRIEKSATEVIKTLDKFSLFSEPRTNNAKCETASISVKKGVKMALCVMDCIDLKDDVIKILGIDFSYNKKLEQEKKFLNHIVEIQNILKS